MNNGLPGLEGDVAIHIDSKFPQAHNLRGALLAHDGAGEAALGELREAARLYPAFALAHLNTATILPGKSIRVWAAALMNQ